MGIHCKRRCCAFCANCYTDMKHSGHGGRERFWVECPGCKARGPVGHTREEATEAWDARDGVGKDRHGNVVELRLVKRG